MIGSFVNVVVLRLHTEEGGTLFGRSHCPKCKHTLSPFDLIPLFSWIFLGGKCRYCKKNISFEYPLMELFSGISFLTIAFLVAGQNINTFFLTIPSLSLLLYFFILTTLLLILFFSDIRFLEIHTGIAFTAILTALFGFFFLPSHYFSHSLLSLLIGISIPTVFFGGQLLLSKFLITKWGQWVGEGDLFLGILMGVLLGWEKTILALMLAYFIGGVIGIVILSLGKRGEIAFGPFLIAGMLISFFFGNTILLEYKTMIGIL